MKSFLTITSFHAKMTSSDFPYCRCPKGNPGRYSFCFAENEDDTSWLSIAEERGVAKGQSAVTLLTGDGLQPIGDERSRHPESLAISLAAGLRAVYHHKWNLEADVILAVAPEHSRVFEQAGWSKARLRKELEVLLQMEAAQMVKGIGGCAEGIAPEIAAADGARPPIIQIC